MSKNMNKILNQAQQMQQKMTMLQKELDARQLEISAGGGMVQITINGKQEISKLTINPECVSEGDIESLEELVMVAVNQAVKESQEMVKTSMSAVTGGLSIPGLF